MTLDIRSTYRMSDELDRAAREYRSDMSAQELQAWSARVQGLSALLVAAYAIEADRVVANERYAAREKGAA